MPQIAQIGITDETSVLISVICGFKFLYLTLVSYLISIYYGNILIIDTMKTLSLKLDDHTYDETEELLQKIKKPRNRYINEAISHYNRIQKRKLIAEQLASESAAVSADSLSILAEFEKLDDHVG